MAINGPLKAGEPLQLEHLTIEQTSGTLVAHGAANELISQSELQLDGDERESLLKLSTKRTNAGSVPMAFIHPIPRGKRFYMVAIYCMVASLLFADQNLMAPNLTLIQRDFGFTDLEKDQKLGGLIAGSFFLVGAPSALLMGVLTQSHNRRNLLFIIVLLGEAPCIATYWVRHFWQLLLLRLMTGISLGGILPLTLSLLGDLYPANQRAYVAALVQVSTGFGMAVGQMIAGFVGPPLGWRVPFVIVAIPTIALATLMLFTVEEPSRGVTEAALQAEFSAENYVYEEQLDWAKVRKLAGTRSNVYVILQGLPGCLPWGMFLTFFNDYLSRQKGLSIPVATMVVMVWGLGGGVGVIGGGWTGQLLYNRNKGQMPVTMGLITTTAVLPMLWVVNASLGTSLRLGFALVCVFLSGLAASVAGPNVKAILMNVNEPESRGVALALHVVLDDLGKSFGPAILALLITIVGRQQAFSIAVMGWLPCGILIACAGLTLEKDEADMQQRLTRQVAMKQMHSATGI